MPEHYDYSDDRLPKAFYRDLELQLKQHPEGISEYALLKNLKALDYFGFLLNRPAKPDALYMAHFLLFHALYRLQKNYYHEKKRHYRYRAVEYSFAGLSVR